MNACHDIRPGKKTASGRIVPAKTHAGPFDSLAVVTDGGNLPAIYVRLEDGTEVHHPVGPAKAVHMALDLLSAALPFLSPKPLTAFEAQRLLKRVASGVPLHYPQD